MTFFFYSNTCLFSSSPWSNQLLTSVVFYKIWAFWSNVEISISTSVPSNYGAICIVTVFGCVLNIIRVSSPRVCVCVCCFTASFFGCVRQILLDSTPSLPTETSLIRICCTNWRMLPRRRSSETFPHWDTCSSLWPDPAAPGLVQSYLAHMPPCQGLTYPWTNLIFLTGVFCAEPNSKF